MKRIPLALAFALASSAPALAAGSGGAGLDSGLVLAIGLGALAVVLLCALAGLAAFLSNYFSKPENHPEVKLNDDSASKLANKVESLVPAQLKVVLDKTVALLPAKNLSDLTAKVGHLSTSVVPAEELRKTLKEIQAALQRVPASVETSNTSFFGRLFGANHSNLVADWKAQLTDLKGFAEESLRKLDGRLATAESLSQREGVIHAREAELQKRENDCKARETAFRQELEAAARAAAQNERDALQAGAQSLGDDLGRRIATLLESARKSAEEIATLRERLQNAQKETLRIDGERQKAESQANETGTALRVAQNELGQVRKERDTLLADREAAIQAKADEIRKDLEGRSAKRIADLEADVRQARDTLDSERRQAKQDAQAALQKLAGIQTEKDTLVSRLQTTDADLAAEKTARRTEADAAQKALQAEKEGRAADKAAADKELSAKMEVAGKELAQCASERDAAKARLYPAEIAQNPDFAPLLAQLDEWESQHKPGAALARAALAVFAQRSAQDFPAELWLRALSDLSRGIAMATANESPDNALKILADWKKAIAPLGTDPYFSLSLPSIGERADIRNMKYTNKSRVSRVLSWAVYDQTDCKHPAEII